MTDDLQNIVETVEKTTKCDCDTRNFLLQPTGHTHMCRVHIKVREAINAAKSN